MAAVLWSLPMLASGLVALLRYGFGSVFVIGESVAAALLRSSGADISGTLSRMEIHPVRAALQAACGLMLAAAAASMAQPRPGVATVLATLSAAGAWWYGEPLAAVLLGVAAMGAIVTVRG